jgi:hypothetical protein
MVFMHDTAAEARHLADDTPRFTCRYAPACDAALAYAHVAEHEAGCVHVPAADAPPLARDFNTHLQGAGGVPRSTTSYQRLVELLSRQRLIRPEVLAADAPPRIRIPEGADAGAQRTLFDYHDMITRYIDMEIPMVITNPERYAAAQAHDEAVRSVMRDRSYVNRDQAEAAVVISQGDVRLAERILDMRATMTQERRASEPANADVMRHAAYLEELATRRAGAQIATRILRPMPAAQRQTMNVDLVLEQVPGATRAQAAAALDAEGNDLMNAIIALSMSVSEPVARPATAASSAPVGNLEPQRLPSNVIQRVADAAAPVPLAFIYEAALAAALARRGKTRAQFEADCIPSAGHPMPAYVSAMVDEVSASIQRQHGNVLPRLVPMHGAAPTSLLGFDAASDDDDADAATPRAILVQRLDVSLTMLRTLDRDIGRALDRPDCNALPPSEIPGMRVTLKNLIALAQAMDRQLSRGSRHAEEVPPSSGVYAGDSEASDDEAAADDRY